MSEVAVFFPWLFRNPVTVAFGAVFLFPRRFRGSVAVVAEAAVLFLCCLPLGSHAVTADMIMSAALSASAQTHSPRCQSRAHQGRQTNAQPQ